MTRDEAISYFEGLVERVAGEFCISQNERDKEFDEADRAFNALGVTESEREGVRW